MASTYTANGRPSRASRSRAKRPGPLRSIEGTVISPATRNSRAIRNSPNGSASTTITASVAGDSVTSLISV